MATATDAPVLPIHRLHLRLSGRQLTVLHVRNEGQTANYFTTEIQGADDDELRLNALLTSIGSVPYGSQVFIHTPIKGIKELLRKPANDYPKALRKVMRTKYLRVRGGSAEHTELFWKSLLDHAQETLPPLDPMDHYRLHTYAVTDGLQTHVSGLLYGEGEMHLHTGRYPGEQLQRAEVEMACWALDLVGVAKSIEMRHQHPDTNDLWQQTETYVETHPEIKPIVNRIGTLVGKKHLRFNVPTTRRDDVLTRAIRLHTGLNLR